jgi:hypothetical protein
VQVRAHPQTVFIQQPLGQRMQPQTIAVSQLTKPKYGSVTLFNHVIVLDIHCLCCYVEQESVLSTPTRHHHPVN